jgi:hypothetical protein
MTDNDEIDWPSRFRDAAQVPGDECRRRLEQLVAELKAQTLARAEQRRQEKLTEPWIPLKRAKRGTSSYEWLRRRVQRGDIPSIREGGRIMVRQSDVDKLRRRLGHC